jgi:transposase
MAPRLSKIERKELQDTIISKFQGAETIKDSEIAKNIIPCSTRSIRNARTNILQYGTIDAPSKPLGRRRKITENMWLAIEHQLKQYPNTSQQALADLLYKEYDVKISRSAISRVLKRQEWTKKVVTTIAKERNQDLRDDYIDRRAHFDPKQMIFVDESGDDRGIAIPRLGYAPKGVTPKQIKRFHRGKRVSFLPAYTIDGIIYSEVYEGYTDVHVFESFLERLLPYCGRFPEPRSVVFMDNASFHNISTRIKEMFAKAGVLLEKQSPYSPDLNPIEYYFGALKNYIRSRLLEDEDLICSDFKSYLQMQIKVIGQGERGKRIPRGHFKKAQIYIE